MSAIVGLAQLACRRALARPELVAIRFAGMFLAVTLMAGVSLYSGAMGDAMLQQRIETSASNANLSVSLSGHALSPPAYAALDGYVRHGESADLGVPLGAPRVHHTTAILPLYRLGARGLHAGAVPLAAMGMDYYEGIENQVTIFDGSVSATTTGNGDIPVFVSGYTARSLKLRVGDRLAYRQAGEPPIAPAVMAAGIFVPDDVNSTFWDTNAGNTTYRALMAPNLAAFQAFARQAALFQPAYFWLQTADVHAIHLADSDAILAGIGRARSKVAALATGTVLITSLDDLINAFHDQYSLLSSILLILIAPVIVLMLYGIAVITTLTLDRQAGEIVLLRSRGATTGQVVALYLVEGVALAIVALTIGPFVGLPLAREIGKSSGFLSFNGGLPFTLSLRPDTYFYCALTALLCVLDGLIPAVGLARRSMLSYKHEQARPRRRPLWQRLYLDIAALAISLYGYNLLVQQGTVSSGDATAVVARDPLIAAAPLLFALGVTLLLTRILPRVAALGLRVLATYWSPPAFLAMQRVARAPSQPMRLVQLCTLTLTVGIFAATVAGVQSRNLSDQYLYQAGAPLRLGETLDRTHAPPSMANQTDTMPLAMHLALPGVTAATPALRYESFGNVINMTDSGTTVDMLGVDPATAARVMWYRPDFANQSFQHLLKYIQLPGENAIVSDSLLNATGLHVGDVFGVTLTNGTHVTFKIVADTGYFPSLDPSVNPFIVTNLAYLEKQSKSHGPNEVWLEAPLNQTALDAIAGEAGQWPRQVLSHIGLPPPDAAQGDPLKAGIYGVVSIGFLIAVTFVLLGFVTYAYLTLQDRLVEVATLQALGFSGRQVRLLLLFEEVFLLATAMIGGIVAGLLTVRLFLPYLPIAANVVPPFIVVMPWAAVGEFMLALTIVFIVVLTLHISFLLRLQVGRVLRLGDG
jgi:putative ABC transport system permease protein